MICWRLTAWFMALRTSMLANGSNDRFGCMW